MPLTMTVAPDQADLRLDLYLARVLPDCSARGAKRLLDRGLVLVDGIARPARFRLRKGDAVTVLPGEIPRDAALLASVRLVLTTGEYAVFFKPAGLHTAHVSGSAAASLEAALPAVWPLLVRSGNAASAPPLPVLLTRLDAPTSGLILASLASEAAQRFRRLEAGGAVEKEYAAVVRGRLDAPLLLRRRLDTAGHRKTRVLAGDDPDTARHTLAEPAGDASALPPPGALEQGEEATLITIRIRRGARHQIRAHLAAAGFPLVGDTLYGPPAPDGCPLYLHHARLSFPGLTAHCPPEWGRGRAF